MAYSPQTIWVLKQSVEAFASIRGNFILTWCYSLNSISVLKSTVRIVFRNQKSVSYNVKKKKMLLYLIYSTKFEKQQELLLKCLIVIILSIVHSSIVVNIMFGWTYKLTYKMKREIYFFLVRVMLYVVYDR